MGVIREVQETATNISYKIDDMTGNRISVKKWIDNDVSFHLSLYLLCDLCYFFHIEIDQGFYILEFVAPTLLSQQNNYKIIIEGLIRGFSLLGGSTPANSQIFFHFSHLEASFPPIRLFSL